MIRPWCNCWSNFDCALCEALDFNLAMGMPETGKDKFSLDSLSWMKIDPVLDGLRPHARYVTLVAELDAKPGPG